MTTTVSQNKLVAQRFLEDVLNGKRYDDAGGFFSEDAQDHFTGSATALLTLSAFPDYQLSLEHMIEEGDLVTVLATFTGTHKHRFMGIAPTQKGVTGRVAFSFRMAEGRIAETWTEIEPWGLLQQLGAPGLN
jgi:predicted ester cyclase